MNGFGLYQCMRFGRIPVSSYKLATFFAPIVIIFIVSIYSLWPLISHPGTRLPNNGDDLLITWIINDNIHKIPHDLGNIFNGNIYFPYKNTKVYSELFLPSALLAYVPVKLSGLPVLAYNSNLLMGQFLTMLVVFLWLLEMSKDKTTSLLGAVALGLSEIRFHYIAQLQMWQMQWWLMAAWMIWKYATYRKRKYLIVAFLFTLIQFWESLLPVYFILLIAIVLLIPKATLLKRDSKIIISLGLIFFIVSGPVTFSYINFWKEFHIQRTLRDAARFSLGIDDLWGKFLSPGLYSGFIVVALFLRKKFIKYPDFKWVTLLLFTSLIISFGPVLKIFGQTVKLFDNIFVPLPYGILYYVVPGFGALRTPSRWIWVTAFAASAIIALILTKIEKKKYKLKIVTFCFLLVFIGSSRAGDYYTVPKPGDYPEVYQWLKNRPENSVIELPIYSWGNENSYKELLKMLYSLEHRKSIVNGASGFSPPEWEKLVGELTNKFPDNELTDKLKSMGVELVIIHKKDYDNNKLKLIHERGKGDQIWEDEENLVYKL